MENFQPQEKPIEPAASPEVEKIQQILVGIQKNEAAFFADHGGRRELSGELEEAAKELAEHDSAFKEILVDTFREYVEGGLSSHSGGHWMDKVFIEAFTKYQDSHH